MASSDAVLAHTASEDLPSSSLVVCYIFGTRKTLRSRVNSWESLYSSLMRRIRLYMGFIPAARSPYYRPLLKSSSVVRVSRFETTIDEVIENAHVINVEKFILRKFDPLQGLANTNLELLDVVGQIQSVQVSDLTDAGVTTRVVVHFLIELRVVLYLSLWDDAASIFGVSSTQEIRHRLSWCSNVGSPYAIRNTLESAGNLYLNSTPATKFYFDPALQAIAELRRPIGGRFSLHRYQRWHKKKEVVSIGELNKFIINSDEHEADFICKARVVEVLPQNGTGLNGDDNATFVVFDWEMMNGGGGEELPQCVKDVAGKEFIFQIRVTPFNFFSSHRTFTVSAINDSIAPEVEGGEASASDSKNVKDEANEPSSSADGGA
ncbi:hypothetical protein F2Q69_00047672 [Brassica cretica]|uniref:DUF223 domain-containing protein n=1 Tax=Brassica cretica TaxID=69181 RepID=A0A8S9Q013_BRACR|nr:hypothetical protein F2Q69_00047672 [Brassica cretica]